MRLAITFLLLFATTFSVFGQQKITGIVLDKPTQDPLIAASVYNQQTGKHTHTDIFGKFTLADVNTGDSIAISFIGYQQYLFIFDGKTSYLEVEMAPAPFELNQITILPELKSTTNVANIDLKLNPINSSQEILRKVPGLFIAQHAGGGKAEQIFLRGFDIDHGTDIQISADGLPVNMVSHAHGQGYADLHFLIPETIEQIDFGKGPYYANKGNFTTAGYVDFQTYNRLASSLVKLEVGRFNTLRMLGMIDVMKDNKNTDAYIATEYLRSDGPFESSQNFDRLNLFGKFTTKINESNTLKIQASTFQSKWTASGQIPVRAVESGLISRFGSIDDTEGGQTSRSNIALNYKSLVGKGSLMETNAFFSKYDFELFSNFTFFLNDPVNGDQIAQREERNIFGFNTQYTTSLSDNIAEGFELVVGAGFRYDDINGNELSRTKNRTQTLSQIAFGEVNELNGYAYANLNIEFNKWLINPGLRIDYFDFQYYDILAPTFSIQEDNKTFISPKLNIIFSPNTQWQLFLKAGRGFHSNDSRVVVAQRTENVLPAAYGTDLGASFKPLENLYINVAYWYLFLEQEFVYVGDEGVVEPSGKTVRTGVDLNFTYQPHKNFFVDASFNITKPTAIEAPSNEDYIPLAPTMTSIGGLSYIHPKGFSTSLRYRYLKDRPANETNSVIAKGYFITDFNMNYDRKNWGLRFSIENLFNNEWNEAQFDTESRLFDETESVSEIHFTPGTPIFFKGGVVFKF